MWTMDTGSDDSYRSQPALHGYGRPPERLSFGFRPSLSIAISREAGARGRSVAMRTAELLGWQYFDQERLGYLRSDPAALESPGDPLSHDGREWIENRMRELVGPNEDANPGLGRMARVLLELMAREECVLLERGAGLVAPPDAVLSVRLIAPLRDRIAFLADVKRLSWSEAEQFVAEIDRSRGRFAEENFGRSSADLSQYDLVLNTAHLGIDACAETLAAAVSAKDAYLALLRRNDESQAFG